MPNGRYVNQNEYDEDAYLKASDGLAGDPRFEEHIEGLWKAGGTVEDIQNEVDTIVLDTIGMIAERKPLTWTPPKEGT